MTRRRAALVVAAGLLTFSLATPVLAAGPYPPPSKGSGKVVPSRIKVGQCATFSGDGFAPQTAVAVADNGAARGTATTTTAGRFSIRLCYPSNSQVGRHDLTGTGRGANGAPLTVSATLIVEGVRQSADNPGTVPGGSQSGTSSPQSVSGPGQASELPPPGDALPGTAIPVTKENSGARLIMLGLAGLGFAFLASLLLLLIARRRRRRDEEPPPDVVPAFG